MLRNTAMKAPRSMRPVSPGWRRMVAAIASRRVARVAGAMVGSTVGVADISLSPRPLGAANTQGLFDAIGVYLSGPILARWCLPVNTYMYSNCPIWYNQEGGDLWTTRHTSHRLAT